MELYIIRHAQSENNALWARTGQEVGRKPDPELTAVGHQQAQHLAQYLSQRPSVNGLDEVARQHNRHGYPFTHLYSSLMLRAVQTGHYVAEALDMPLHVWEEIHEWGGIYAHNLETGERVGLPGVSGKELTARFPRLVLPPERQNGDGWWNRPFEPREATQARAERFWQALLARHGQERDRVAIVTHGGFSYALLMVLLASSGQNTMSDGTREVWFSMHNTSVSRLDVGPDFCNVRYLNRVAHLPPEMIT